uniref:Uncharacterized protein n=1 Tax=Mycena chlorophos TaxID=658473 RepID=A0ABQ0LMK3_MYCCL|nr:predicted protein [Mycena chlorophos]
MEASDMTSLVPVNALQRWAGYQVLRTTPVTEGKEFGIPQRVNICGRGRKACLSEGTKYALIGLQRGDAYPLASPQSVRKNWIGCFASSSTTTQLRSGRRLWARAAAHCSTRTRGGAASLSLSFLLCLRSATLSLRFRAPGSMPSPSSSSAISVSSSTSLSSPSASAGSHTQSLNLSSVTHAVIIVVCVEERRTERCSGGLIPKVYSSNVSRALHLHMYKFEVTTYTSPRPNPPSTHPGPGPEANSALRVFEDAVAGRR